MEENSQSIPHEKIYKPTEIIGIFDADFVVTKRPRSYSLHPRNLQAEAAPPAMAHIASQKRIQLCANAFYFYCDDESGKLPKRLFYKPLSCAPT